MRAVAQLMHRLALPSLPGLVLVVACGEEAPTEQPPTPASVTITPPTVTLAAIGETVQLTATVRDTGGGLMSGVTITWTSSDATVATVDGTGQVTAVKNGSTGISAVAEGSGVSGAAALTVAQQAVGIHMSAAPDTFRALGDTARISAAILDRNGHPVGGAVLSWSSSDESVATVDAAGLVATAGNGRAIIAAASGAFGESTTVTVAQQAEVVRVSGAADTVRALGAMLPLAAQAVDRNGYPLEGAEYVWSSGNESVATVDATGLVTTVEPGSAEITAELAGTGLTGTATVVIELRARDILAALYDAAGGSSWANNRYWLSEAPLDSWSGVTTDAEGRVTGLSFGANRMRGHLPRELGYLEDLQVLELETCDLRGPIPPELGKLANLRILDLSGNRLTGGIPPELGSLANLTHLDLFGNDLTGRIPSEFGSLASLEQVNLSYNGLWGGIPETLGHLSQLTLLALNANELGGGVPPELGNLSSLQVLALWGNTLDGSIPPELAKLTNLTVFDLRWNDLGGPVPAWLGGLEKLTSLHLNGNVLTGQIPSALEDLVHLEELGLRNNRLWGQLPRWLGNLENLRILWLSGNRLEGPIPSELGSLIRLRELFLDANTLTGTIPPELGNLVNLHELWLRSNNLAGSVPPELGGLTSLRRLFLEDNPLAGPLPQTLTNIPEAVPTVVGGCGGSRAIHATRQPPFPQPGECRVRPGAL